MTSPTPRPGSRRAGGGMQDADRQRLAERKRRNIENRARRRERRS